MRIRNAELDQGLKQNFFAPNSDFLEHHIQYCCLCLLMKNSEHATLFSEGVDFFEEDLEPGLFLCCSLILEFTHN